MYFLGYRIQIDIKVVPSTCIFGDTKGESFTNTQQLMSTHDLDILNFSRHSSYSSATFIENLLKVFPFKVDCVQTNNGLEFTKRLIKDNDLTLFEKKLQEKVSNIN